MPQRVVHAHEDLSIAAPSPPRDTVQDTSTTTGTEPSSSPWYDAENAAALRLEERHARRILLALQYASRRAWAEGIAPVSELTLPHGFTDPENAAGVFVNTGMLFPHRGGQPTVLTAQLTLEYEPWQLPVSPFIDVGAGGNIVLGRGRNRDEAPNVEWLWSSTAGVGCKLHLERLVGIPLSIRVLGQLGWAETARVPLASVFSGWSLAAGVEYHFEVPELRLLRQLSHGEDMPEGW